MRTLTTITSALFAKHPESGNWESVALPHTWNNLDGQDGGADYYRGTCAYRIALTEPKAGTRRYLQFEGANHVATVYADGKELGSHKGGFSTFRVDVTDAMNAGCREVRVEVDNVAADIYPQQADFTFFGGLYRNVTFIEVNETHFDLMKSGTSGVFVTPNAGDGSVRVDAFTVNAQAGDAVECVLLDKNGAEAARCTADAAEHTVLGTRVENPELWDGTANPALYIARLTIVRGGEAVDSVDAEFGFRSFSVDPDKGFILNGRSYPLHGVSRHQDRFDKGWAISRADHEEDLALIREVGANTIRLAHYQHDQYFYTLCDRAGMVLWAEIPFISVFMESKEAHDNTISQMTELIAQNYNHPAICFWGISNEILIGGDSEALVENLKELHALAKKLDPSRLTTMAQVSMTPMDSEHNHITDVLSYNHYFGWYMGDVEENGPWLDEFHAKNPQLCLGVSEYGAEGVLKWHSAEPRVRDYSEEYQAHYHEKMLETFATRPYLWSTHVWNMFDFAADARDEGGVQGRNNKGLVTYDRKTKKDSFYACKAWWSDEAFVRVAGSRFVDRAPGQRNVKVYSNQPGVTLFVNGEEVGTKEGAHVFVFENIALRDGENTVTARAGACEDTITLRGVAEPNKDYVLPDENPEAEGVTNWFEGIEAPKMEFPAGYYSIKDNMKDLLANPETAAILNGLFEQMGGGGAAGKSMKNMMGMLGRMPLEQILKLAGNRVPKEAPAYINGLLTKVKKA